MTSPSVRAATASQDMNHRDPAYIELVAEVKRRLGEVHPGAESWTVYLVGGSGTAALEAMLCSCIQRGPVLLVTNGYYSERLGDILDVHQIEYETLTHGWLESISPDRVADRLRHRRFETVIATHNETTTGRLNPLSELGALCKASGCRLLVDGMSSFGADPVDFASCDAVSSSSNKCLHGVAGLAFVMVSPELSEAISGYPRRSFYLNLGLHKGDNPRLTPPVPAVMALRQALREMAPGYASARRATYLERRSIIRAALNDNGLECALAEEESSCTLTTARLPRGCSFESWSGISLREGFMVYGCKGSLESEWFQVANMGELPAGAVSTWAARLPAMIEAAS
mgnify:CR=1 FL=1